ncbi:MAG TPA: hypothetical protein ENJ18_00805 [Nannocystis exedens]|nr:hypothetical protein [Nannocystis exedens]
MRPPNAPLRCKLAAGLAALSLCAGASACHDGGSTRDEASHEERGSNTQSPDEVFAAPTVRGLLKLLSQNHRSARRALGRHRLSYSADFSLLPPALPRPKPDEHLPVPQEVHDELLLEWAADDDRDPALHLRQGPQELASREIIIIGKKAYSRLPYRGWLHRDLDSEIHWTWLDDAERSVHDLVAFAGPSLAISALSRDEERLTFGLALAPVPTPLAHAEGPAAWRTGVEFSAIQGTIEIDREHGLWMQATIEVAFSLDDVEGRTLTGSAQLSAERELTPEFSVTPPASSAPFPERIRYKEERRRLLDGLSR